ncbi:hypothetical protein WOLCODRAFT_25895 [Wolfiporia cocos MD-104 SS10]|uniref:C2H2-type domain-containing protein n=1 Tax=Wolfiporia cocos (strain MD-104) TaxID=742152 RepID=A0A2H3JMI3_WOLCO|nr:hypothetical protein WOLCODRAFT_25895 [Wolfiporia cocos MD-104 SS10]
MLQTSYLTSEAVVLINDYSNSLWNGPTDLLLHDLSTAALDHVPNPVDHGLYHAGSSEASAALETGTACTWDNNSCGSKLTDLTPSGIRRHLKAHHFGDLWNDGQRGICRWLEGGKVCGKELRLANLSKHIASVHMRSTRLQCPRCLRGFSRPDALRRHSQFYCVHLHDG